MAKRGHRRREVGVVVGDRADEANEVDAISGATMTSDRVEEMLNGIIERIASGGVIGGE